MGCSCAVFMPEYDDVAGLIAQSAQGVVPNQRASSPVAGESHLSGTLQLTFGGQNAEAYWSKDGKRLIYQSRLPMYPDEQIFTMNADGSQKQLVSTGLGRTTCSYFSPNGKQIYFSSTHDRDAGPQRKLDMSLGYVWMVNPSFSLYRANADGTGLKKVLDRNEYVAETTIDPNGKYMVFTGAFDGDLDIYRAKLDGTGIQRLTHEYGYDGGPFVSWDGKQIVYRRAAEMDAKQREEYAALLKDHIVRPGRMEIWMMDANGKNKRQITRLGGANFAPFVHPDGRRIIFSSNWEDPKGREFDLYLINTDGTGLKRVTTSPEFDGFPMFTRDGKRLVWASNRQGSVRGETNIFVADWKD